MQYMNLLNAMQLAPEGSPVEGAPVPVLQVNQKSQDQEHDHAGQNALLIHEVGETPRRGPRNANAGNGSSKVNDSAKGVKPRAMREEMSAVDGYSLDCAVLTFD